MVKEILRLFLKTIVIQTLITAGLLLAFAFVIWKAGWGDSTWRTGILFVYGISSFGGGVMAGRETLVRRYRKGMAAGLLYFLLWILIRTFYGNPLAGDWENIWLVCGICAITGMLGGMLAGIFLQE